MSEKGSGDPPVECVIEGSLVRVKGEIDLSTAPRFYEAIVRCADESGRAPTIDLSGVDYLDSAGIQALMRARSETTGESDPIRITGVRPHVMRILRIVGLDREFEIYGQDETDILLF
ncbi:MAG: STAS domain-containing protein [Armatimonadetes bacterium]|nr:STAS domain-containing protein [Armatimonadota bacterium]